MSQATLGGEPFQNSKLFSSYYLSDRIGDLDDWECDEAAADAFERLRNLWELEAELVGAYEEDELLDAWIDKVIEVLGFDSLSETTLPDAGGYTDRLLFDSPDIRRDAAKRKKAGDREAMFGLASVVLEAKQWDADFTTKFDEQRSYRDASHQIKYYLERTPERLQWGILTNGRKWRLYGTKDYATEIYYEVDLPALLTSGNVEQFKYFFAFFRREAFRETAGTSFLDTVWAESETAAQQLGEDLQDNVFTALRVLGEGFIETNDLDIDPSDAEARAELKEQSLVLLYRLMFILYAESRGLIHPDDPAKQVEYEEHFSLEQQLLEIHEDITSGDSYEDFSGYSTQLWGRLQDLFALIDEGQEDLGIPPYNGGLFDDGTHEFLAENEVADRYLAEVIHRLGTTEGEDGMPAVADYADLDTRHLGSIYEGLLEHEFRIAPEQYAAVSADGGEVWKPATEVSVADAVETVDAGGLYVVNDDGERKATGAYYTPDYVVSYIVEETIDPLVAEIKADLSREGLLPGDMGYFGGFYSRVLQLRVLDPAMGSAHFLTSATAYLTEQVMEVAREQEQGRDEQEIRRTIAKECIYGVDINGMAVELGKLSMWLETLAADKPLAFLDHHLKAGNSLVGSDITDVLADDSETSGGQLTLSQSFARARQQTLGHVMDLMADLLAIDNDGLADIKSMEELYDEIRDDPLYGRLFEVANVHTAQQFGVDVPDGVYEKLAGAIDDGEAWTAIQDEPWFQSAQALAREQSFFHWELEYPEVFFNGDGEKMDEAGFDAVIGNPPWVDVKDLENPEVLLNFFETSVERVNIYTAFIEHSNSILHEGSQFGIITPNSYLTQSSYRPLRKHIINNYKLETIVRLPDGVFSGVTMETAILIASLDLAAESYSVDTAIFPQNQSITNISQTEADRHQCNVEWWLETDELIFDIFTNESERDVIKSIEEVDYIVSDEFGSRLGITPYDKREGHTKEQIENRVFHSYEKESENHYPITTGKGIRRYRLTWEGEEYLEYGDWLGFPRDIEFFTQPRCIIRQIVATEGRGIYATYSEEPMLHTHVGIVFRTKVADDRKIKTRSFTGILNSKLMTFYHRKRFLDENKDTFQKILIQDVMNFPLPNNYCNEKIVEKSKKIESLIESRDQLNISLLDHLGAYDDGPTLSAVGLTQPPRGSAESILQETATEKPNLRVGEASVVRESPNTVEIRLTARYKPSEDDALDESEFETDQWGYTETAPRPALRITDLTEAEADLIEAFVPVAVDEAGGFAGFRETATKTNSLVDRLRKLTLPRVGDVQDGLEGYLKTKARAEELEAKIEKTDALIDEIVYELYGLTDEEIEIVEDAVGE